jgi:deoxyribonuclease (pyrimidine dimer)
MTRINVVPPAELSRQHLVAEYRELPRIFNLVRAAIKRGERPCDPRNPPEYTLGRGHVRFFYPRLGYLAKRQGQLVVEMQRRGYSPQFVTQDLNDIPLEWFDGYTVTPQALAINRARIKDRS